jgi:ribose 5-phosphate isomerase A
MQQRPAIARVLAREPPKSQAAAASAFSSVHRIITDRLASPRSPRRQQSPGLATLVSPAIMSAVGALEMSAHTQLSQQDQWKKDAGEAAAKLVEDGMVVGLGTGSTAAFAVAALGRRVKQDGLRIVGIPTSERTAEQANAVGIPLTTFAEHTQIDLTVDGADEVLPGLLYLIKGHGGALLREKIVAAASKRMAVVADDTKLVKRLGELVSVPVEVVPFGWQVTAERLRDLGGNPAMRLGADQKPFITDGGHYILNCAFGPMDDPKEIAHHLDHVVGLVEHGLFLKYASEAVLAGRDGVKVLRKGS